MPLTQLGVCYYPEHWPREDWPAQAACMREGGIQLVRIAEFAWSRIEPSRNQFDWAWLDESVETLAAASLSIIMCTPTACPPKWLIDEKPSVLPVDSDGKRRGFGSRRHYRFASRVYREESQRISRKVIGRYAHHPAIVGWQTDNEYGCHETTLSYSPDDCREFQSWLEQKYGRIDALNTAWGCVFWSQEYARFAEIELPNLTVTEANPAHRLDYWRFASDQVRDFNYEQATLLRDAPGPPRWLTHNYMGNFTDFDHFALGRDLDVASWDSYPLGFLDQGWASDDEKLRYRQIGHPDWAAFHHDLYRAVGRGRLAVMEQQPGPVNWAPSNALPLDNAPAFWAMEAAAHGAEFVSFFRYQQLPVAQEQMHAALRLPTGEPAPAWGPVRRLAREFAALPAAQTEQAKVALLFDYPSCWISEIQPHAQGMHALRSAMSYYGAARALGLDVDIVSEDCALDAYQIVLIPGSVFVTEAFVQRCIDAKVNCLIGPRSGSRTHEGALPDALAPGPLQRLIALRVIAVDSMRKAAERRFTENGESYSITRWYEVIDSDLAPVIRCEDGAGLWYTQDNHHYLNAAVPEAFVGRVLQTMLRHRGQEVVALPEGLRLRRRGPLTFAFNFSLDERRVTLPGARRILGESLLQQGDYAVWIDE